MNEPEAQEQTWVTLPIEEFVQNLRMVAYLDAEANLTETGKDILKQLISEEWQVLDVQEIYHFLVQDCDLEERDIVFLHAYMFNMMNLADTVEFAIEEYGN